LEHLCYRADTPKEMIDRLNELFYKDFTTEEIERRKLILEDAFSNHQNAMKIIHIMGEKEKQA